MGGRRLGEPSVALLPCPAPPESHPQARSGGGHQRERTKALVTMQHVSLQEATCHVTT